ncbi:MAG: hypothetical protein JXQ29_01735 [Planctomycetes bacterium]|nr:hypothetical protein [Planctomycetota bacterium]
MPSKVGNVTLTGKQGVNETLVGEVAAKLKDFGSKCAGIKCLCDDVDPVTVEIEHSRDAGVTKYRAKKIAVGDQQTGGVQEIAEAVVFELLNWEQGDFCKEGQDSIVKSTAPLDAGKDIARDEAWVTYLHAMLMNDLKKAGVGLSQSAQANMAVCANKSPNQVVAAMLSSPHQKNAAGTAQGLLSHEMYMYEAINNRADVFTAAAVGAASLVGGWLQEFVKKVAEAVDMENHCTVYIRLLDLIGKYGQVKQGYAFSQSMKNVAPNQDLTQLKKSIGARILDEFKTKTNTGALTANLKAVKLLN